MPAISHANSYYAATAIGMPALGTLTESTRCDVCVVGGGFTGLSAALHLAERGYDVLLLEANKLGWGASGRNGGQLGSGLRGQESLERLMGLATAQRLWDLCEEAKRLVRSRIDAHAIPCDLTPGVLSAAHKPRHAASYESRIATLRDRYGYQQLRWVSREEMAQMLGTTRYHGGLLDEGAAHLHPLNYALGLARAAIAAGARLFEGSEVLGYDRREPTTVRAREAQVTADYLVLACNAYLERLEPRIAGKIMPINNFLIATEPLGEARARALIRDDVAVADSKYVIDYYRRSADHRLLFGGGESYTRRFPRDIASFVRRYLLRVFPQLRDARIDYAWGGTLAVTLRRYPHFGRLDPNAFFAHGYSGHGLALSTLAGKLIADAVAGTAEDFDVCARLPVADFPGGTALRWPALVVGMLYYALLDKL